MLNAGTLPLRYELTAEHDGDLLAGALRWDVWVAEVCSSSLRATGVDVLAADVAIDELDLGFRSLGVATSERICLRSTLPATTGNTHQGRVLDLTFVASAEHDLAAEQEGDAVSDQPLRQRRYGRLLAFGSLTSVIAMMAMVGFMLIDGYRPVVITTGSMGDTAPPSSIIVAAPRPAENVQLGDILVMQRDGRATVTHRVVAIEPGANDQRLAITKGSANPVVDAEPYRLVGDPLVGRWIMPTGGGLLLRLGDPFTALAVVLGAVSLVTFVALRWIWWAPPPQAGASEESDDAGAATATGRRPARVAVSLATFLGVFFGGVAWSLFDANDGVANNQFGTAACFDATVAGIQSGVATNAAEGVQQITVGAVDPTRSILLTSARGAAAEPADAMVVATLADATTIELTRRTDAVAPPALDVAWTLVEFQCGVTVQRGTTLGNDAAFLDIAVSPVDTDDSFVLTTSSTDRADSAHDGDDDHLAVLAGASTLRLRAASGGTLPSDHLYGWQLLSYSDGGDVSVQTDMATLSASDNLTINLATPVDPASTLIIAHAASAGTGAPIGDRQVRAHLSSPSTVQLTRLASGGPLEVTLQIVTFTDGTLVQHGIVNLANGQPSADVALNPVDPSRATAMSTVDAPGSLSGGATDSGDPTALGSSSATFALSDPATLRVERTDAGANASFGWQVIEWGGPSWWDTDYPFRQRIDVTTTSSASPDGYSVPVTIDHANMVTSGLSLASGDDLRLLRWDGASWVELDRVLDDASGWDNAATTMWFRTTASIDVLSSDSYWLYYGNPAPPAPMADPDLVWLLDEDFESGTLGAFEDRTGGTGWYTADAWTERIPLTVSSAEVDQDLFDFPVLVRLVDAALGQEPKPTVTTFGSLWAMARRSTTRSRTGIRPRDR
ncbi:MAG: hypothetical protein R2710_14525 [Acidimicrobiales bacterium]